MTRLVQPVDELDRIRSRSVRSLSEQIERMALGWLSDNHGMIQAASSRLASIIAGSQGLADLLGRRRMLLELDSRLGRSVVRHAVDDLVLYASPRGGTPIIPDVTFVEAVKDIATRDPRLARGAEAVARVYTREHGFGIARQTSLNAVKAVQKIVLRALDEGVDTLTAIQSIAAVPDRIKDQVRDFSLSYAETVFRTNVATAYSAGRFQQALDPDLGDFVSGLEYSTAGDSDVRGNDPKDKENHKALNGLVARADDPVWNTYAPPLGYNCFAPDTVVSGRLRAASKAFYSGPMVELETRAGYRLAVTVNHPILTPCGWRPAGALAEGDDLACYGVKVKGFVSGAGDNALALPSVLRRAVDNEDMPARIEDVFESLRTHRTRPLQIIARLSPLDLHGDAERVQGDVHVVRADGLLDNESSVKQRQFMYEFRKELVVSGSTSAANSGGVGFAGLEGAGCAPHRLPGGPALSFDDSAIVSPQFTPLPLDPFRLGPAANLYAVADEEARNSCTADARFIRQLKETDPGTVCFDELVRIRRFEYSGHVYDLETEGGWIVANGIYTSNCRCSVRIVTAIEAKRRGLLDEAGRIPDVSVTGRQLNPSWVHPNFRGGRPDFAIYQGAA